MSKTMGALTLAALLWGATPAQAEWVVQGIPGASCVTDERSTGKWRYTNRRLVNTDSDPWGVVFATCPVSLNAPGLNPREYRIQFTDPQDRDSWCQAYRWDGALHRTQFGAGPGTYSMSGSLAYPLGWTGGLVEVTFHCLLQNGASLDRIEIVWWKP